VAHGEEQVEVGVGVAVILEGEQLIGMLLLLVGVQEEAEVLLMLSCT
jgi:hypothetical protein